jgi:hypothetical protein
MLQMSNARPAAVGSRRQLRLRHPRSLSERHQTLTQLPAKLIGGRLDADLAPIRDNGMLGHPFGRRQIWRYAAVDFSFASGSGLTV